MQKQRHTKKKIATNICGFIFVTKSQNQKCEPFSRRTKNDCRYYTNNKFTRKSKSTIKNKTGNIFIAIGYLHQLQLDPLVAKPGMIENIFVSKFITSRKWKRKKKTKREE